MRIFYSIFQYFNRQDKLLTSLLVSIGAAVCLLAARIVYSQQFTFITLIWNLFLAYIPFFLSRTMKNNYQLQKPGLLSLSIAFTWLIFFPNAPYILTDFFHLQEREGVPLWFDLIIIALFAWNGLIIGFLSLKDMQQMIAIKYGEKYGWTFTLLVILLGSFGIYIGRYLRYNSWDVFLAPYSLTTDILKIFLHPLHHKGAFGMTIGMAIFLMTSYYNFSRFYRISET
ncbi:MAG TPA: DUF1361 domain-containing protein [Bacteroidales bacterium]|nr:DUF1361 domain-containing protein [Bacteroidales bacterium]